MDQGAGFHAGSFDAGWKRAADGRRVREDRWAEVPRSLPMTPVQRAVAKKVGALTFFIVRRAAYGRRRGGDDARDGVFPRTKALATTGATSYEPPSRSFAPLNVSWLTSTFARLSTSEAVSATRCSNSAFTSASRSA